MDDWENKRLGQYIPLCMARHTCGASNHVHMQLGVTSTEPPMPGGGGGFVPWHNEETDEFFYPFDAFLLVWN